MLDGKLHFWHKGNRRRRAKLKGYNAPVQSSKNFKEKGAN